MQHLAILDWLIIGIYLGLMVFPGVVLSRRGGSFREFFLAGRSLTPD